MKSFRGGLAAWVGVVVMAHSALADVVAIDAAKDNTLYEDPNGQISNGSGSYFFAGTTAIGEVRRGVIAFDITGNVPPGATITGASLTLNMSRTIAGDVDVGLHRVEADWGEGASDASGQEGAGAPAEPGDATWIHTFFDTAFWANVGGDFSLNASAVQIIGDLGFYTWESTEGLVADVQAWLNDPLNNFGWLLLADETNFPTAKRFDTKDHIDPDVHPVLTVEFTPPGDCDGDGDADLDDFAAFLNCFTGPNAGPVDPECECADIDADGDADFDDFALFQLAFTG
ncbi:MAG: DNRLRE domain-containing protein [Planctomycetes bacterium]|nr:DNRLRE domain-containing protein [Planctomycetota bacterium]